MAKLGAPSDAEDVAAETFAVVLRELPRFKWKGGGFEAWLFRIAANLIVDHFRSSSRESATEDVLEKGDSAYERTPETELLDVELAGEMSARLDALPADQREVLLLRFAAGLDTNEVGNVMGRKANAVRQLQFRALTTLRERMREEEVTRS